MDKKPKVLFTYVEAGMGHIIPMKGMSEAFTRKYGDKCEIVNSYVFEESKDEDVNAMGKELSTYTKKLSRNWFYNKFESISYATSSKFTLRVLDRHFKKPAKKYIEEFAKVNPDLTVASYYLPAHLAHKANKQGKTNTLIATYTPDPYVYPAWDRNCDMYIVNNDVAHTLAVKKGFKEEQIKQIPFILRSSITDMDLSKEEAKASVGLDNRFTILFSSGAYGAKGTKKVLQRLIDKKLKANLVVICGKSQSMMDMCEELKKGVSEETKFHVIGFTDKMANYMRGADVMIGKSGMNTLMEAAYLDCPSIINAEANRLEIEIRKFCIKEKIAIREANPKKIANIIESAVNNPEILKDISSGAEKYRNANGAEEAADALFELLKTKFPNL